MTTLKSHICKAYKEREEITKKFFDLLCKLENKKINESDYDYKNYGNLIEKIEDKDYNNLLEDNEIKEYIQKITGKEEIKIDFFTKGIIDKTVFDIMIFKINYEERKREKSKELRPESSNIDKIIKEILDNPDITNLKLMYIGLTDDDIEKLVKILPKTKIRYLDLFDNNIGADGAKALAKNKNLRYLNLGKNKIGDDGAKALAENKNLRYLNLRNNNIGDDGAKALAKNKNLRYLGLWYNDIGDDGAKALAENKNFRYLDLGYNFDIKKKYEIKKLCEANNIELEIFRIT